MFSKTVIALAFAAVAQIALAAQPSCLLGAVNTYDKPSDITSICKSKNATTTIAKFCGDQTSDALSAFADICNAKGIKVSTDISTSTGTSAPSGTAYSSSHASVTGTGASTLATATGTAGVSGGNVTGGKSTPTASGTGAPAGTGAATRLEVAGAAILMGLVAVAL